MLNKIVIMGRLTRDPELRRTQSGVPVTTITLAVDRDYKEQNGERQTDFIDVVAWRGTAEFVAKHFSKGRVAVAEGRLQIREYTDKDGIKRKNAEVVADNVYFGDSKPENQGTRAYGTTAADSYGGAYAAQPGPFAELVDEDDGELPF